MECFDARERALHRRMQRGVEHTLRNSERRRIDFQCAEFDAIEAPRQRTQRGIATRTHLFDDAGDSVGLLQRTHGSRQ